MARSIERRSFLKSVAALAIAAILPFKATAQAAKRVVAKYRGYSVTDYGAVGDGVTDDTAAIQEAMAANRGVVQFPPGVYRFVVIEQPALVEKCYFDGAYLAVEGKEGQLVSVRNCTFAGYDKPLPECVKIRPRSVASFSIIK